MSVNRLLISPVTLAFFRISLNAFLKKPSSSCLVDAQVTARVVRSNTAKTRVVLFIVFIKTSILTLDTYITNVICLGTHWSSVFCKNEQTANKVKDVTNGEI
jgi:hypothetical protein